MNNINKSFYITRTAVLLALALAVQFTLLRLFPGNPVITYIVGSVLNTVFFLAAMAVGLWSGLLIGFMTPLTAFLTGHLPFAVLIPFVVGANILLVSSYYLISRIKKGNKYIMLTAGACASLIKFAAMSLSARFILPLIASLPAPAVNNLAVAWSIPQLVTAFIGLALAFIIYNALKRANGLTLPVR